ncbi:MULTISPECIES: 3D domain-containing protein [Pelosinus]|uniref:3D domain-containing protein n=1 Tax=Pelosinus fermentans B4 TaxID=1149862 RepID=I8RMU5_9FIRM|nr:MULTISPECIES: 3D domain-containing protein [Pelosinus]EIW20245.1 3D domain-containing protein [Pelosinus fermentans B4]EIW25917.1 3D domain-containing protein [Pelosinus fermentans A11]OAM93215.1 3D domain-containing protein [Pelosinus fermentans DSM 17108]SDQ70551.1 3D (Asp-Asp-Asp) domain-containing protein [Pelosinus fermentans]
MKHMAHKRILHLKRRYKHIAAAFAGAILISSALLPGIPVSTAHAAMKSNVGNTRNTSVEKMENENRVKSFEGKKGKRNTSEIKNTIRQNLRMNKTLPGTFSQTNKRTNPSNPPASSSQEKNASIKPELANKPTPKEASPTVSPETKEKSEKTKKDSQKSQDNSVSKENTEKKQSKNAPSKYEKVLDIKATAYSPGPLDNDQWGDKTYLGTTIRPGVVAVDPKVIPLGSRLYVEYPDGHGEYAVAEDTGGAIKGNRIDIAIMNRDKATEFGIKPVKVYVVNTPKE